MPITTKEPQAKSSTSQEGAEELLRQIRLIVDNSHDAIIGETLDGTITSWNGGAAKMFGYTAFEVVGKSVIFLFPPDMKDEMLKLLSMIKAGEVIADYDSVRICKDGSKIHVALSISPVQAEDGTIIGASIVERDITVRKQAELLLRQTQLIVDNSYDAIIGETLDGTITTWNGGAAKMFGYSASEVVGKSVLFLFPDEMKSEVSILLDRIKAGETIADYDSVRLRKDGSRIEVAISISPVHAEDGTVISASIVERDITVRKKAELHIEEQDEVRNKFIAIISHQLRTPLTAVNWNLEALLNGDFGKLEETQRQFLQATHNGSLEITHRINNLLTAMDVEDGRLIYTSEEVDINNLCVGVVSELLKKCELKDISCTYIPPASIIKPIIGDGQKIRMAIFSLLENAVAYTKDKGAITITLQLKGDIARLEVIDTGVGIPEAEKKQIFSRFFRASNASIMHPDAFGLGLFLAKNFVEQHHGLIGFESEEGKGSKFWFELPLKS